jgi:hypothetical protein
MYRPKRIWSGNLTKYLLTVINIAVMHVNIFKIQNYILAPSVVLIYTCIDSLLSKNWLLHELTPLRRELKVVRFRRYQTKDAKHTHKPLDCSL